MKTELKAKIEEELLANLNPVQKQAVLHNEGPLLILAGAGSGKTRVITHRIAYLCRVLNVPPYRVCAVTFTNKAAGEMHQRLYGLIGPMADSVLVRTFHSLGLYILRRNAPKLGLKSGFSIYDQNDQEALIKRVIKDLDITSSWLTPRAAAERINRARDQMVSPEKFEQTADRYEEDVIPIYREYMIRLRKNNALDFGDLIYETVRMFEREPEVLADYQSMWRYFMIDEYQDTNHAQYMLGRLIARDHTNIAVVGDDDQSIYSWRGADIENILSFEKDYPNCTVLRLEENYRSTAPILKAASSLIAHNSERREKTLFTRQPGGEKIHYTVYESDTEEAAGAISRIKSLKQQGIPYAESAVFYRTNAQSRHFEELLRRDGIPYLLVGGFPFYDRKEIKDLIAYLSVVVNPEDSISLMRIINTPARGFGEAGLARLEALSVTEGITLYDAMARAGELQGVRGSRAIMDLHSWFENWRGMNPARPSLVLESIIEKTGYLEFLAKDENPGESRIENVEEFASSIQEFEESESEPNLSAYLQQISLYSEQGDAEGQDAVNLITLHNAKGLEYRAVFFTGLEEGTIPHTFSLEDNIEEERRLAYVGITRAREFLYLSSSRFRRIQGSYQPRLPSRFISEIDVSVFEEGIATRAQNTPRARDSMGSFAGVGRRPPPPPVQVVPVQIGDRIRHKSYGPGTVVEQEDTVAGAKIGIQFDGDEKVRYFLARFAPIEKIE
ncbi:MAG TPA: UvrD-helicase domain-containing protein [Leptospiraceae bacterium]|nr:UvrD-helicase domain-containing protein [Leptospiraceae bacterium]